MKQILMGCRHKYVLVVTIQCFRLGRNTYIYYTYIGEVVAWWLESWACNLKVAGSILAPAGIEGGDCE